MDATAGSAVSGSDTRRTICHRPSAGIASTLATYQRRAEDWDLQRTLADRELAQLEKQAAAADIRIAIAELELRNHASMPRSSSDASTSARIRAS